MSDQEPSSKPESAEQPIGEGLSSSALFSVVFHARPTFGPAEGAEVVVPVNAALEFERRLSVIAADAAAIRDEWLETQPDGIRLVITNIRRLANLSENTQRSQPVKETSANENA